MALTIGEPAPWFTARTANSPEFPFSSAAGRFVLLGFLPSETVGMASAIAAVAAHRAMFDDARLSAFLVVRSHEPPTGARDMTGIRWILDADGSVSRLYGTVDAEGGEQPSWLVLDPTLRVLGWRPMEQTGQLFESLGRLPLPADHAGVPLHAPVLTLPRVFDPDLCQRLIAYYERDGGAFTGVMRDFGAQTQLVLDEDKKRRDVTVSDPALIDEIRESIQRKLFPQLRNAFQFQGVEIERYIVSCYDAADGGVFRAHRDNTTHQTANRKFACSINLNDDFEGGDLRFPEYGLARRRPPAGGAVIFSCSLLHEVTPMKAGRRYAFLPFFYDEEGARILEAYRQSLKADPA